MRARATSRRAPHGRTGICPTAGESATVVYLLYGTAAGVWTLTRSRPVPACRARNQLLLRASRRTPVLLSSPATNDAGWGTRSAPMSFVTCRRWAWRRQTHLSGVRRTTPCRPQPGRDQRMRGDDRYGRRHQPRPSLATVWGACHRFAGGSGAESAQGNVWMALFNFGYLGLKQRGVVHGDGQSGLGAGEHGEHDDRRTLD